MRNSVARLGASLLGFISLSQACSRVTYKAQYDDRIVIGRSMDFVADTNTTFRSFPAGIERNGGVDDNPLKWTSKYGSVTSIMYNILTTEGMNTKGVTGSTLYLGDSTYGERNTSIPGLFVGAWLQYCLDNYATVEEIVDNICPGHGTEKFQAVTKTVIKGLKTVVHLSLSDLSGDNLVMEYVDDGRLTCYHSKDYNVMTNEPTYDQQLAIDTYWEPISNYSLPGTDRPAGSHIPSPSSEQD